MHLISLQQSRKRNRQQSHKRFSYPRRDEELSRLPVKKDQGRADRKDQQYVRVLLIAKSQSERRYQGTKPNGYRDQPQERQSAVAATMGKWILELGSAPCNRTPGKK